MTDKIDDGGAAFPDDLRSGMSLRDYFAAEAMKPLLYSNPECDEDIIGDCAYRQADAMLRARKIEEAGQ